MRFDSIPLVPYSKGEERLNCVTHALGLLLSGAIAVYCLVPALRRGEALYVVSASLYLFGTTVMFLTSALYHGWSGGNGKRVLRLLDHCMIFFAVAGTATGCVPAVYDTVGIAPAVVMIAAAWTGAVLGLFLTLRDFEGTRGIQIGLYVATGVICAVSGAGAYKHLPKGALAALLIGGAFLIVGTALYGIGKKKKWFHSVFHIFIDLGLTVFFLGISAYVY